MKAKPYLIGLALLLLVMLALDSNASYKTQTHKDLAHTIAEMMREEGFPEDHPIIKEAQKLWQESDEKEQTAQVYTTMEQRAKYPVASFVWQFFKENGYSDEVAAGIIGNMMAECGGQTLDLDPYIYSGGFYGLCMFSLYYFPEVDGMSVPEQLQLLVDTLDNIEAGGGSVETFLALTDEKQAAKYFSDYYERPAQWSSQRATNASNALEYFGG